MVLAAMLVAQAASAAPVGKMVEEGSEKSTTAAATVTVYRTPAGGYTLSPTAEVVKRNNYL